MNWTNIDKYACLWFYPGTPTISNTLGEYGGTVTQTKTQSDALLVVVRIMCAVGSTHEVYPPRIVDDASHMYIIPRWDRRKWWSGIGAMAQIWYGMVWCPS